MTPKSPLDLTGKSVYALKRIVRKLEGDLNSVDAQIHNSQHREGRLFLDNKMMKETLQNIFDSDCESQGVASCRIWIYKPPGSRKCVHLAAHEVLEQIRKKGKKT